MRTENNSERQCENEFKLFVQLQHSHSGTIDLSIISLLHFNILQPKQTVYM